MSEALIRGVRLECENSRSSSPKTDAGWLRLLALHLFVLGTLSISGCTGVTGTTNKSGQQNQIPTATPALLNSSATSLAFANVNIGSSSILGVTFTNAENSRVTISNVSISGAGFSASGVPTGQILAPGQTATLDVTFTPVATASVAGAVTLTSNATNSPATISLSGTGVQPGSHSVTLNWAASTSVVAGYNVYRSTTSGGPYAKLNSTLITTTQYADSTVQAGQTYFYVVTSVDSSSVQSAFSNAVSATIPTS
jgi:hypothetical protein